MPLPLLPLPQILVPTDERFAFAYQDVLGFKLAAPSQHKERSAGFR